MTELGTDRLGRQPRQSKPVHRGAALDIDMGALSIAGGKPNNEDSFRLFVPVAREELPSHLHGIASTQKPEYLPEKGVLLVVADGMGGGWGGKTASDLVVNHLGEYYYEHAHRPNIVLDLGDAVADANRAAYRQAGGTPDAVSTRGPSGSTVVAAVLHADRLYVANVGDSRAYLAGRRGIRQLTVDHSVHSGPGKPRLSRYLGAGPEVEVDESERLFGTEDTLVLCSDGLSDLLTDEEILRLTTRGSAQRAAERLVRAADEKGKEQYVDGRYDNITAVVARHKAPKTGLLKRALLIAGLAVLLIAAVAALAWILPKILPPADRTPVPVQTTETPGTGATAVPSTPIGPPVPASSQTPTLVTPGISTPTLVTPGIITSTPQSTITPVHGLSILVPPGLAGESPVPQAQVGARILSVALPALLALLLIVAKLATATRNSDTLLHRHSQYSLHEQIDL